MQVDEKSATFSHALKKVDHLSVAAKLTRVSDTDENN